MAVLNINAPQWKRFTWICLPHKQISTSTNQPANNYMRPICGKIIKSLLFFIFGKKKSAVFKKISSISNIFIKFASFPCHFQNDNVDNVNSFCKIEFIQIKFALKLLLFTWKRTINIILMLIYATRGWNLVLRLSLITRYLWCICVNRITLLNRKHCAVETTRNIYKPIMLKLINKQCAQHQYLSL